MSVGIVSPEAERRLNEMVRTQDGFEIAELDLVLRGAGEMAGTRQAGWGAFRIANPVRDEKLLKLAKAEAVKIVEETDPEITAEDRKRVMEHLRTHWQRRYGLVEVG